MRQSRPAGGGAQLWCLPGGGGDVPLAGPRRPSRGFSRRVEETRICSVTHSPSKRCLNTHSAWDAVDSDPRPTGDPVPHTLSGPGSQCVPSVGSADLLGSCHSKEGDQCPLCDKTGTGLGSGARQYFCASFLFH